MRGKHAAPDGVDPHGEQLVKAVAVLMDLAGLHWSVVELSTPARLRAAATNVAKLTMLLARELEERLEGETINVPMKRSDLTRLRAVVQAAAGTQSSLLEVLRDPAAGANR